MGLGMRARQVGWRLGLELHSHYGGPLPVRIRRAKPVGPLRTAGRAIPTEVEIELGSCVSFLGVPFVDGDHPLVQTLLEYDADPQLTYAQSTMARVHESFQPTTLAELFFTASAEPAPPLDDLGPDRRFYRYIWLSSAALVAEAAAAPPVHSPNYSFGPLPLAEAEAEFDRLIAAYRSIRDEGYRPDSYGHVTGYFIGDDDRHRFVVGSGNHRAAALAALGVARLPARLHSHPASIHRADLDRWTTARGGPFERATAERLFDLFVNGRAAPG